MGSRSKPNTSADPFWGTALGHLNELFNAAMMLTRERSAAQDLVQETYRVALEHRSQLRELGRCRAWLFRILRNLHVDSLRRARRGPQLTVVAGRTDEAESEGLADIDPHRLEAVDSLALRRAFESLSEPHRTALMLCDVWGFRYEEIADILQCPIGTVRSRIARGRERVAALLGDRSRLASATLRERKR